MQDAQVPFDPDFDKSKAPSVAAGFSLNPSMKQVFLAGAAAGVMAVASLGFVLSTHPEDPGLKRGVLVLN